MIKGIVFDKDGTLFDFRATWEVWTEAMLLRVTGYDRDRAAEIGAALGFDLGTRQFEPNSVVIAGTLDEIADKMRPFVPDEKDLVSVLVDEAGSAPQVEAVPLLPLLTELKGRGLRLGVATNDGIEPALAHLSTVGLVEQFDFIAGYDSGFGGKPAPGQLKAFCAETGLAAQDCLMVGDSLHDLMAGRAAGMGCVGVLTGMAQAADLAGHADAILQDVGALPEYLDLRASP